MIKTLIISGGNLDSGFVKNHINKNKYNNIIAVDKGLEVLDQLNINPNYIIGDFDSVSKEIIKKYNENIIKLNKEKDFTDTHIALKLAIKIKSNNIVILGGIGTRIDHTMGNIHILKEALEQNVNCRIINENNMIFLIDKKTIIKKDDNFKYVSIIPLTTTAEKIIMQGFKYTLNKANLKIGQSIGISNEQISEQAMITLEKGILIVIYSKD